MSLMEENTVPVESNTAPVESNTAPDEWFLAEGVPGIGDAPEYYKKDKYGTVADQAKAYRELESRFGSFTGAPRDGKYSVNLSDEIKERGIEIGEDDPLYQSAVEFAQKSQMNQEGFDEMMNLYVSSKIAENEALEEYRQSQLKSLGDNAQERINNLISWGKANLPVDLFNGFQDMAVSATAVKAMEKLIGMTRNAPVTPANHVPQGGVTAEEVRAMQFEKDEFGQRRINTDPEFRKKFQKAAQAVWGNEEHRVIIGGK